MSARYDWWGYVKGMIRRYPHLKARYADIRDVSLTAKYGEHVRSKTVGSSTEIAALRELPLTAQREYEAVKCAADTTSRLIDGAERLRLVDLVFWRRTHTLAGAAMQCHVSYRTAQRWHGEFIRLVAFLYGLMDEEG